MQRRAFLLGTASILVSAKVAMAMPEARRVLFGNRIPTWVPNPANPPDIAINWKTNQVWKRNGGLTSPASLGIATSRASTKLVADSSGYWTSVAANVTARSDLGRSTEEARTNLQVRSTPDANWTQIRAVRATGISSPASPVNDATTTSLTVDTSVTNTHGAQAPGATVVSGSTYTASIFARSGGGSQGQYIRFNFLNGGSSNGLYAEFDLVNGTVATAGTTVGTGTVVAPATITAYANGWYRISVTGTLGAFTSCLLVVNMESTLGTITFTGDGTSNILLWGAQIELGVSMTSPIVTAAATVTRAADVTTLTGLTPGAAYTIFEQATPQTPLTYNLNQIILSLNDNSSNNRAQFSRALTTGLSSVFVSSGGVQQYNISGTAWAQNTSGKMALAAIAGAQNSAFNGTALTAGTGATMPVSPTQLNFGYSSGPALFFNGLAAIDAIWLTQAVPLAELKSMTT